MDLQKVGDVIFNNEKYNILKPTVHVITDYFKEHMLRTEKKESPDTRIFIDHNGFRHTWSGFGKKTKSLRKTDLNHMDGNVEETTDVTEDNVTPNADLKTTTNAANYSNEDSKNSETNEQEVNKTSEENKEDSSNASLESKKTTTTLNIFRAVLDKNLNLGLKHKVEPVKKAKKLTRLEKKSAQISKERIKERPEIETKTGKERTIAKTTFFCPFLGVITMSAFID
uniref:Uncharacterized protein n=1 Tax=Heliothis virescens TaxID=7102 RepID=A0A2A4JRE7_HELVI